MTPPAPMPRACPVCHEPMVPELRGPVTIDRSPTCGTLWLDRTELAAIVEAESPGASVSWGSPDPAGAPVGPCPVDGTPTLEAYRIGDLSFQRCPACRGVAIGAETLERLLLRSQGVPGGSGKPALGALGRLLKRLFGD